jgi:flagella basal body P-ring formation protein FlgA
MILGLLLALLCAAPQGDKILARDLAAVEPAFAALPGAQPISYSPQPGLKRVFTPAELRGLAQRNGIEYLRGSPVCFEWAMRRLDESEIRTLLSEAAGAGVEVELLEYSKTPVPQGAIVFPKRGLSARGIWKGYVEYTPGKRFEVWARVRVMAPYVGVVATEPIRGGAAISGPHLRLEQGVRAELASDHLTSVEAAAGRVARRLIAAGTAITEAMLEPVRTVARGEALRVDVKSGGALISFAGTAESAGCVGDVVSVRNPSTRRVVRARITGPGRAEVNLGRT